MELLAVLLVIGIGCVVGAAYIPDRTGQVLVRIIGIACLVIAALVLLFWVVDEVDDGGRGDRDLGALLTGPMAWLAARR